MSKSRGNVVEPWDVISAHGADAFRWYYLTAQQPWSGYRFSVETVGESVRQFLLTLWNTYSFWVLYANAEGLGPATLAGADAGREAGAADDLDRWILSRLQSTTATVIERMDDFDCTAAGRAIAAYVEDLSNWYVRLSRRRFWEGDRAAFATLRHCLLETVALLAPFIPFLADEIHAQPRRRRGGDFGELPDSVHLRDFPEPDPALADPELEAAIAAVRRTVALGRAARAAAKVKVRQPLRRAVIVASERRAGGDLRPGRADRGRAQRQAARVRRRGGGPGQLRRQAQLPQPRPALRQADAPGGGGGRGARRRPRRPRRSKAGRVRRQRRRARPHPLRRRRHPRPGAARGLRGRVGGRARRRPAAGARRRASPRGPGAGDRPRRPERPAATPASRSRTGSSSSWAATASCSRPPASTRHT